VALREARPTMRASVLILGLCAAPVAAEPALVSIGVYLRNVDSIDFEDNTYSLDFDLWMRWTAPLEPPPTDTFRFVNARDLWGLAVVPLYTDAEGRPAPRTLADGSLYQRFHVEGTFYHKFWLGTYPLDWQKFTINVEDRMRTREQLVYLPDLENSAVYGELQVPGWSLRDAENEERVVRAETSYGDPERRPGIEVSRYRFGVRLYRPARFFVLRLLPPLLMVFLTSVLIFFLPGSYVDTRLAVVSTGILSEIFLQLTYTQDLPSISISTINDSIYNLAYGLLILAFAICVASGRKVHEQERLEQAIERAGPEASETRGLQERLERSRRRLRRLNTATAVGLTLAMLAGTFAIVVEIRGLKDLIW
jgi:hypothetical protein